MLLLLFVVAVIAVVGRADSQLTSSPSVQQIIVGLHNDYRRVIPTTSTFEMSWDAGAGSIAQQWADRCEFRHPLTDAEKTQYLETAIVAKTLPFSNPNANWGVSIAAWYNEVKDFVFGVNNGKMVGHYTQLVWKTTYKIGCGFKVCKAGTFNQFNFFVCDYCPAGNIMPNQFRPYEAGSRCQNCPKNCKNGLCTNPCPVTNYFSNCDVPSGGAKALFPNGCTNAPSYLAFYKQYCKATCQCKGTLLY